MTPLGVGTVQDRPRQQPQLLEPSGKVPFPARGKAQNAMQNGQEMLTAAGHLWVSEKGSGREVLFRKGWFWG